MQENEISGLLLYISHFLTRPILILIIYFYLQKLKKNKNKIIKYTI